MVRVWQAQLSVLFANIDSSIKLALALFEATEELGDL